MPRRPPKVWLFDLDDTLHDASAASMPGITTAMTDYMVAHLGLDVDGAQALRRLYWQRYGATLLGLVKHHGISAAHFLHETHRLPGLEARVRGHRGDLAVLTRLPGRRFILTNAPRAYALRVLGALGILQHFDGLIAIEQMAMFGQLRPKPDARMLRRTLARLRVHAADCVLVEDTLEHQRAARRLGLRTVWMQRWLRGPAAQAPALARKPPRTLRRPAYVDRRIRRLVDLCRGAISLSVYEGPAR